MERKNRGGFLILKLYQTKQNENIKLSQRDITDDFHLGLGQFHGSRNNERINTVTLLYGKNALKQNKNKGSRQRETEKKQETYNKLLVSFFFFGGGYKAYRGLHSQIRVQTYAPCCGRVLTTGQPWKSLVPFIGKEQSQVNKKRTTSVKMGKELVIFQRHTNG